MCDLTLYRDQDNENTQISNIFIDEYLADANDAQIKVYLYLVRMTNARMATNISEIADKFNHTEKDVCRALRYWEKKGLISLDYDQNGGIVGIRLYEVTAPAKRISAPQITPSFTPVAADKPMVIHSGAPIISMPEKTYDNSMSVYSKPQYSLDELKAFKSREESKQLIFVAERYLGKTLSANDMRSIQFYCDELHFSADLIDFLLQYCIEREKTSFAYMDKVAIDWADNNITTVKQARSHVGLNSKKPVTQKTSNKKINTAFHQLEQNNYNFAELEAQLLGRSRN